MNKQFKISYLIFFVIFTVNLFSNESFYTISVCSTSSYKDAILCKDKVLNEHKFDILITKSKDTKYRTNYGFFNSYKEAKEIEKDLIYKIKKQKTFILEINKDIDFELFEFYPKESQREKIAYLTFDDGPITGTRNILEVTQEEGISVSMFFIGKHIEDFKKIYEDALTYSNITIANHTYSHANGKYAKFYSDADLVVEDIKKADFILSQDRVSKIESEFLPVRLAGRNVFRLPEISKNDNALAQEQVEKELLAYDKIFEEGFYIYGWDLEWNYEANGKPVQTPMEIVNKMEYIHEKNYTRVENKVVLLMHDRMFANQFNGKENLQTLITLLKNNGWKFENIEQYL